MSRDITLWNIQLFPLSLKVWILSSMVFIELSNSLDSLLPQDFQLVSSGNEDQKFNILIESFFSNHLTIENHHESYPSPSLASQDLRFCSFHKFSWSKTCRSATWIRRIFNTLNSKLPRETFQCTYCLTNSELNTFHINLFDFSDFSFSLAFFWNWYFYFWDNFFSCLRPIP